MGNIYDSSGSVLYQDPGEARFTNPVTNVDRPDPTIWHDDGWFYMFATPGGSNNVNIMRSKNMVEWEDTGVSPFSSADFATMTGLYTHIWAPCVTKINGKWIMYVTLYTSNSSNAVAVLSSTKANGQFHYEGILIDSNTNYSVDGTSKRVTNVVDPCAVQDIDGTWYLFTGSYNGLFRFQLSDDGLELANQNVVTVAAHTTGDTREGSYLLYRNGYWYYFYSAGTYSNYTYHLLVCRSTSLTGTFVDKDGNGIAAEGNTILSSANGDALFGPGHNGDVFVDNSGKYWMPYHCHYVSGSNRYLCVQELKWDQDGWCYFDNDKPAASSVKPSIF